MCLGVMLSNRGGDEKEMNERIVKDNKSVGFCYKFLYLIVYHEVPRLDLIKQ